MNTKPGTMLKIEAIIFNIPYPLSSGWRKIYGKTILTQEMILRLKKYYNNHQDNVYHNIVKNILDGEFNY